VDEIGEQVNTKTLRDIAEAATPGPWDCQSHGKPTDEHANPWEVGTPDDHEPPVAVCLRENTVHDAYFIATFNPAKVLEMLDELDRLRAALESR
jgi:hypothetical protein